MVLNASSLHGVALKVTLVTACDSAYVGRAIALIRSAEHFSPGLQVILHLVNPTKTTLAKLKCLQQELNWTKLDLSIDDCTSISSWPEARQITYYACARFFALPEILASTENTVIVVDADSLIVNPITPQIAAGACDVAMWRRDLEVSGHPEHMRVCASVIAFFHTSGSMAFASRLRERLGARFDTQTAEWFVDQVELARSIDELSDSVKVANLRGAYKDFDKFKKSSIIWSAKGDRKTFSEPFAALSKAMSDSVSDKVSAKITIARAKVLHPANSVASFFEAHKPIVAQLPRFGTFYVPRLDLPWKAHSSVSVPEVSDQTIKVRLAWKEALIRLANAIERRGIRVELYELPAWEITSERINCDSGDFAIVAHRCKSDTQGLTVPTWFLMQEYLPWTFSLDRTGWGADSSSYPVCCDSYTATGAFSHYRQKILASSLETKFLQPAEQAQESAISTYDILIPLQIPHDQSIRYFSSVELDRVVEAVIAFAKSRGLLVALKPHPANRKATDIYEQFADGRNIFWCDGDLHSLIRRSRSVFTVNSSVGFESLLHLKPVVTFGRALYDSVTIHGTVDNLEQAWMHCLAFDGNAAEHSYSRFIDWFCDAYSIDLSRAPVRDAAITRLVEQLINSIY
jgi:hypothetical protein